MGWFGPRGLASIVFAVIVEDTHIPHAAEIATITYLTVALSVLVHGLTAAPLVDRYVGWFKAESAKATLIESKPTHEHRLAPPGHCRAGAASSASMTANE